MEFRQIGYFLEIVKSGTFQKAADRLGLTQPALSRQMALLERELGCILLHRGSRAVRTTAKGELFLAHAERMKDLWAELKEGMKEPGRELSGTFSISAGGTVSAWILPQIIKRILAEYPGLSLSVREGDAQETKEALLRGDADLGILTGPVNEPGLVEMEFLSDRIVPVASSGHEIFRRKRIRLSDLENQPFVYFHPASAVRRAVEKKTRKLGKKFRPRIVMELRSVESVVKSLETGLGIGFLSEYSVSEKLKRLELPELFAERKFYLCHRKFARSGLSLLVDKIRSAVSVVGR